MREFLLFCRKGWTKGNFKTLREAGRLDVVYQCILMSFYLSHAIRNNVIFHVVLTGPPEPPKHIEISNVNVPCDEVSWTDVLRRVLNGEKIDGIKVDKKSFQQIIKEKYEQGYEIYVLEEKGTDFLDIEYGNKLLFILGDHIGLPKKDEKFALRYGKKVSLGRIKYLASSCICIVNYLLDRFYSR